MAINQNALKDLQTNLDTKGSKEFLNQKDLSKETDVRILPPHAEMDEIYFVEEKMFWIGGKPYTSPATFGMPCPIEDELEIAKELDDPGVNALIEAKTFTERTNYHIPILHLKCEFDNKGQITSYVVVDNCAKTLICTKMLISEINKIVTDRFSQNGTENGIADRVLGKCIVLSKTEKDKQVRYSAMAHPHSSEMDAKWYGKVPNPVETLKKGLKSYSFLKSVIRNYLYNEPLEADTQSNSENSSRFTNRITENSDAKSEAPKTSAPKTSGRKKKEDDITKNVPPSENSAKRRSVSDRLNDL